jgi:hypothetical protein
LSAVSNGIDDEIQATALRESSNLYATHQSDSSLPSKEIGYVDLVNEKESSSTIPITAPAPVAVSSSSSGNHSTAENVLYHICVSENRQLSSRGMPPDGLCFAGVGYDLLELAWYKEMPKTQQEILLRKQIDAKRIQSSSEKNLPVPEVIRKKASSQPAMHEE